MKSLTDLHGTRWSGEAELWLDPLGDNVVRCDCTIAVDDGVVSYSWSYEGEKQQGSLTLSEEGAVFTDSWHQPQPMTFRRVPDAWGLFLVQGEYGAEADWRWRIGLSLRTSTDELVLQMTNVAPWGEDARAVRMICSRHP